MNFIDELNEKQYEAVTSSYKYNRIIAGAGSGKTRVLTYRLAYLISKCNIPPYRLLAITFTNKVAKEMKERTKQLLNNIDLNDLKISTFHSFCALFLRKEIHVLSFPSSFSIIDDEDQEKLIKEIAVDWGYKKSDDVIDAALSFIAKQKLVGNLPGDINESFLSPQKKKSLEFFKEYEKRKNQQYSLDFDDLLIYTRLILKTYPEIKESYNNRYHEILVDEFQDTNDLQYELLTLLAGKEAGIYVVGDPDQTIYTWRGANQKVILDVDQFFYPLNTVILNENYRSTEKILDHSNLLIENNKERIKKDLFTSQKGGKEPLTFRGSSDEDEAKFVVNKIKEIVKENNAKYGDFAILYRSSYSSRAFEKELVYSNIPYKIYSGIKFYERMEVKDCLAYFKLLVNQLDDISFTRIINVPKRGIGEGTLLTIKKEAKDANLSLYNYFLNIDQYQSDLSPKIKSKMKEMIDLLEKAKDKVIKNDESYSEVLSTLITDLGYYDYLIELTKDDPENEKVGNVKALINDIRQYLKERPESTLDEYLQNVTLMSQQDQIEDGNNAVNLMTVHVAKGLEFNYVFVVNFNDGVFPNGRSLLETGEKGLEEERRLAYVAFTRARKELFVTYNYGYSYMNKTNLMPSQFIKEAKLEMPKTLFSSNNKETIYKIYTPNQYNGYQVNKPKNEGRNANVVSFDLSKKDWKVGDKCIHEAFGEGEITGVEGDIVVVNFKSFGVKKMLGSHPKMKKKE